MTPEDRAEVERIANSDKVWIGRVVHGAVTVGILIGTLMLTYFIGHDVGEMRDRITALEAQVRELQGGKP